MVEWAAAAAKHSLAVQDSHLRNNDTYSPAEVKVRGRWYELVCLPRLNSDLFDITARRNT